MIPIEWLNEVTRERDGYRRLLSDSETLCCAAYRLAKAKCLTREHATNVPTEAEVRAAARQIAGRVAGVEVPSRAVLRSDLEARGLLVL